MTSEDPIALCCLLYVSTAIPGISEKDLQSILESSRRCNKEVTVTGLLLYCRGHFIQVLEGQNSAVDQTYERICQDSRHTHIKLMMREPCDGRLFQDWSMAYHALPDSACAEHPSLDTLLHSNAGGTHRAVKRLFEIFQSTLGKHGGKG